MFDPKVPAKVWNEVLQTDQGEAIERRLAPFQERPVQLRPPEHCSGVADRFRGAYRIWNGGELSVHFFRLSPFADQAHRVVNFLKDMRDGCLYIGRTHHPERLDQKAEDETHEELGRRGHRYGNIRIGGSMVRDTKVRHFSLPWEWSSRYIISYAIAKARNTPKLPYCEAVLDAIQDGLLPVGYLDEEHMMPTLLVACR